MANTKETLPEDVAELRRNMATSTQKDNSEASSSAIPSVVCYCIASIMMTLVNKFVVSGRQFNMTFFLLSLQSIVCVICVLTVKKLGVISFRDFDTKDAKMWFPISALLVSVIYTGSKSLQYLSIPIYTIFKNLTIILIAYGEVIWFSGQITRLTMVSFLLMVLSSILAAWVDVNSAVEGSVDSSTPLVGVSVAMVSDTLRKLNFGYFWMLLNCLTSAAYAITGFSDWDSMFYNNLLSIPVLLLFSMLVEDWGSENLIRNFPVETRNVLLLAIAFSGAAAVGISYSTAWCVRTTSSTTYSMVGALNKLPVAASGMLFFGDPVTFGSTSAIGVGFVAGVVYAIAKNNQKKVEMREAAVLPMSSRKS
ncbi:hypothetical protein EDD15DRAFT_2387633 [Pisolithus albus]|nr:hypothetical protein EDD15DRAFT_2387633 [Pisolithus albus]